MKLIFQNSIILNSEMKFTQTFTLTFGDVAENHARMQKIGKLSDSGFTYSDLLKAKAYFDENNIKTEVYHLNGLLNDEDISKKLKPDDAYVLVARKGVNILLNDENTADDLYNEQNNLEKDKKAYMHGKVVDKKARHNLCFGETAQDPDYENKKGTIIPFDEVPITTSLRSNLVNVIGKKASDLMVEGNYYYDIKKCYIGEHGDAERRKVIGVRLGASFKFHYQWYSQAEYDEEATKKARKKNPKARDRKTKRKIGKRLEIVLNHGDLYIMSEKAVGTDWMKKNIMTLRHSAGDPKILKMKTDKEFVSNGKEILVLSKISKGNWLLDDEGYVVVEIVKK
jgi:hypothetical protein